MALKLYALKCKGGYIRFSPAGGCTCVGLNKAGVYECPDHQDLEEALRCAEDAGMEDLRLAELHIIVLFLSIRTALGCKSFKIGRWVDSINAG
ncbi:MAG: hypothetical protein AB1796_04410 [Bacillota bacterium]